MNRIVAFFCLVLFFCNTASAQDSSLAKNTRKFILSHYGLGEDNPIHKKESDTINLLFQNALKTFNSKGKLQYNKDVKIVMRKLYDNAAGTYEDSNDARRMMVRRSQCFAALALMSDDGSEITYMDLALHSLRHSGDCTQTEDLLEEVYCSLLLLRIYIEFEYATAKNYAFNPNVKEVRDYILKSSKAMTPGFVTEANSLVNRWEKRK